MSATPRWPVKVVADYAADAERLDDERFAEEFGPAFLVCRGSSGLHIPDGPTNTMRVDLRLMNSMTQGDPAPQSPAWALRRREDSVYSFISVGRTPGGHSIQDAGSRNQTFVDGEQAPKRGEGDPVALAEGCEVRFGSIEMLYLPAAHFRALVSKLAG
jgi:hypothetical protein